MPLQFAIEELVPRKNTPKDDINRWNSDLVYHPVSQDVAETDDNGVFAIFSNNGEQITLWDHLNSARNKKVQKSIDSAKSSAAPHKDIMGEELAIGDYVAMSGMETADLTVGKVIAFTEKKVRVIKYSGYHEKYSGRYETVLKNASGLIKIQPEVLSD